MCQEVDSSLDNAGEKTQMRRGFFMPLLYIYFIIRILHNKLCEYSDYILS